MSSSNRGGKRRKDDYYKTPIPYIHALMHSLELEVLQGMRVLDPAAGDGRILRVMNTHLEEADLQRVRGKNLDIRPEAAGYTADFLKYKTKVQYDLIVTNPPYSLAVQFLFRALNMSPHVMLLLPLNWLGSTARKEIVWNIRGHFPRLNVLSPRPCFATVCNTCKSSWNAGAEYIHDLDADTCPKCHGKLVHQSDSNEYAWYYFGYPRLLHNREQIQWTNTKELQG